MTGTPPSRSVHDMERSRISAIRRASNRGVGPGPRARRGVLGAVGVAALLLAVACSGRDRPPPEVPGVELGRMTTVELDLYRRVLATELSPCGGRQTLEVALRAGGCPLAVWAARFVAHRVEENDSREEIAEAYVERYGATRRQEIPIEGAPVLGPDDADVTLVVFSDFTCPHCGSAAAAFGEIAEELRDRVRLVYRCFPLFRHRGSAIGAVASLAAARQGRFWELHDAMYAHRRDLSQEVILGLAEEVGLDMDRFRQDVLDPAIEAQVRADHELGERLGVRGTPTLFINGRMFDEPMARLRAAIDEELARAEMNRGGPRPSKALSDGGGDAE